MQHSHSLLLQKLSHSFHHFGAVACVLILFIAHKGIFIPYANQQKFVSDDNSSSTTSLSTKVCSLINLRAWPNHHKLLLTHPNSSSCISSTSIPTSRCNGASDFIYIYRFFTSIFLFDIVAILLQLPACWM